MTTPALPPAFVTANPRQVRRILNNLIDNAVRHAASAVHITVTSGSTVMVDVSDDGAGIDVPDRGRVFERFVRLDSPRTRAGGGTGLGLAIARDIARSHGGEVLVLKSQPGTTMRLSLPAALELSGG